ncbi:hypothetical protein [Candidatus Thiodictyon syntrophicum]|jgi:predicted nucleic acid-binding protein|nr:hypothetical protein [Candidatus Thiodictyon syntrophicum]
MSTEVFLDTAYAIALSSAKDQLHVRAIALAEQMEAARIRLMQDRGLTDALTTDEHFQQAGFWALLREGFS